ncbi:TadE/TadG family type IV pilus assembly protein [Albibacillus kandeliae]|uniref:TadE/TadG family type IV pilus assembly protein n=1 Tax=Albibacillus kandeliae TaxID=2174228 RepID=UPI000D699F2F|nr:TadE/TadG family type IV pilus assembly protein [Albibacillus kandeliae]
MQFKPKGHVFRAFARNEEGTSTVEFVIIFPAILVLILTFVALSTYIATISDVQQVASELTRQSLRYVDAGEDDTQLCATLNSEILPVISQEFAFADSSRISGLSCSIGAGQENVSVSVTYDLNGHYIQRFGSFLGLDVDVFTRRGYMRL